MKKASIITVLIFFVLTLLGCGQQEMTYVSRPIGYGLISDTLVAKGSFDYYSDEPFNVNELSMDIYYLPSVWGEIELGAEQQISEDNPNFIFIDYNTPNQKVFAKYIFMGWDYQLNQQIIWTATIESNQIIYSDLNGINIIEVLANEQEVKTYIEALEYRTYYFANGDAYFDENDPNPMMTVLDGYQSKFDTVDADPVFQKVSMSQTIQIDWTKTSSSFPNLSTYFPEHDASKINALFQRVFQRSEESEYRTVITYKRK